MNKKIKIHGLSPDSSLFFKVCALRANQDKLHAQPSSRKIYRQKIKPLNLLLLVSIPFLITGLILTINSYNRYLAVEAAAEQLEFIKNLPFSVNAGETQKMPLFCENLFLSRNPQLRGTVSCEYYEGRVSIRRIKTTVIRGFFSRTEIECLLDARSRN